MRLTAAGLKAINQRIVESLRAKHEAGAAPKKNKALRDPGLPNLHQMFALDNALQQTLNVPLSRAVAAQPCKPLARGFVRVWEPVADLAPELQRLSAPRVRRSFLENEETDEGWFEVLLSEIRVMIHEIIDMCSKGWCIRLAMYTVWYLRGSCNVDICHRRHNGTLGAHTAYGGRLLRAEFAFGMACLFGPFEGQSLHGYLVDTMWMIVGNPSELSRMLYEVFYHTMCKWWYRGRMPSDYGTEAHRASFLASLPGMAIFASAGINFKLNRWYQYEDKVVWFSPFIGICAFVGTFYCLVKGSIASVWDTPFQSHTKQAAVVAQAEEAEAAAAAAIVDFAAGAIALAAAGAPLPPAPTASHGGVASTDHIGRSVKLSNEEVSKLRSNADNGMELATRIWLLEENNVVVVGTTLLGQVAAQENSNTIRAHKTQRGSEDWCISMASWGRVTYLNTLLDLFTSKDFLLDIGFMSHMDDGSTEFSEESQGRITTSLFEFLIAQLLAEIVLLRTYAEDLPGKFAALLSPVAAIRAKAATWIRLAFERLEGFELIALDDDWIKHFLLNLCWPHSTWVRELIIGLLEMGPDADQLPPELRNEVRNRSRGPCSTKPNEDENGHLKKKCRAAPAGTFGLKESWWQSCEGPTLKMADLAQVAITTDDHLNAAVAGSKMTGNMFSADRKVCSLGAEVERKYLDGPKEYPSMSDERWMQRPSAQEAMMQLTAAQLKTSYYWKMAQPGWYISPKADGDEELDYGKVYLVLDGNERGAITMELERKKQGMFHWVEIKRADPDAHEAPFVQFSCADWKNWRTGRVECCAPEANAGRIDCPANFKKQFVLRTVPRTLTKLHVASAKVRGFRGLTIEEMKGIIAKEAIPHGRASSGDDFARILIIWAVPDATEEEIAEMLRLRNLGTLPRHVHFTCPKETAKLEKMVDGVDEDDAAAKDVKPPAGGHGGGSGGGASGSGGGAAPGVAPPGEEAGPAHRPWPALPDGLCTRDEALLRLPNEVGCTIGLHTIRAWEVKYKRRERAPRSRTIKFNGDDPEAFHAAVLEAIAWAWWAHLETKPDSVCPYMFDVYPGFH